jgi:hypothetical protein
MIILKSNDDIARMRRAGAVVAAVFEAVEPLMIPGTVTRDIDRVAHDVIVGAGAIPSFLGYDGQGPHAFPGLDMHFDRRGSRSRIPVRSRLGRRHDRVCGRRGMPGRIPRGRRAHLHRRRCARSRPRTRSRDGGSVLEGPRTGSTGEQDRGYLRRGSSPRRGARVQHHSGIDRPRRRHRIARGPERAELRSSRTRRPTRRRMTLPWSRWSPWDRVTSRSLRTIGRSSCGTACRPRITRTRL